MKRIFLLQILCLFAVFLSAQKHILTSPDNKLLLSVNLDAGKISYSVNYDGAIMLEESPLGVVTSVGDFSQNLKEAGTSENEINEQYTLDRIKTSYVNYRANELVVSYLNDKDQKIDLVVRVSNNDIAIRYLFFQYEYTSNCTIEKELTGFNFPKQTTTFLTPQATPGIGWHHTKPSYEEEYVQDEALGEHSKYGLGYTFPSLFHIGNDGWVLVSETGVSSAYCGSRLSEGTKDGLYSIAFPHPDENRGIGDAQPSIALPGSTPWRTITVADNLKPIVETTVPFDLVTPLYEASQTYKFGRSTWSWIMWQDNSLNYKDQMAYIDLASDLGYEYVLIDGLWDKQIGYDRVPELIKYAHSKGVDVFMWYNSNGFWNDAPQGPRHRMNTSVARKEEMKWLQSLGVKGLKVDFFGGDKQTTMQLYEDILSEANEYGLMIIFHGCTLPRGWERMYPNYVGSEAVLASENLIFQQHANDMEANNACLHPFIRNAVGCMEFGPVLLNKRHNRTNDGGNYRRTSDVFQLATAVLFQNPVQVFAIAPNNLHDVPAFEIDFMKKVPTTWDETVFIDGYPGKYCVLARRHRTDWFVVGANAQKEAIKLNVSLPMLAGKQVKKYADKKDLTSYLQTVKLNSNGKVELTIQPNGAVIFTNQK